MLCESRGKEAAGIAVLTDIGTSVYRRATAASSMIKTASYKNFFSSALGSTHGWFSAVGHSRLVTNGSQFLPANNQPVARDGMTTVHNGIIVNVDELWQKHPQLARTSEVDTEVFVALCQQAHRTRPLDEAIRQVYQDIYGMASTLSLFGDTAMLAAATNNGSLYQCFSADGKSVVFASERIIIEQLIKKESAAKQYFRAEDIRQLRAERGVVLSLPDMRQWPLGLKDDAPAVIVENTPVARPTQVDHEQEVGIQNPLTAAPVIDATKYADFEIDSDPIRKLRRCTCCVLPETMPFIEFDEEGVCNYCRTYKKESYRGEEEMRKWAAGVRRSDGEADSVVAFSGGRDSSYGLHYFVKELGLHPVAFSYDWGMVTDLARRNQSRMCDRLGVELILVSADIRKKRQNIRKNVAAWLKKPNLGMVPLFMAGDKQYFYYANQVRKQYGLQNVLLASNPFEKTHFKSGFCGVKPAVLRRSDASMELEQLPMTDVLRMAGHYLGQYLTNPSYINASIWDTVGAAMSYYAIPHDYFRLFSYIPWNEDEVNRVLLTEYDWETSDDTDSTWRIGDGTSPWYNYIYYYVCGFSENDTLRSNQIREGMLDRDKALELVYRDNAPRFESMQWYFDAIGLDMTQALRVVKGIRPLYYQ